MSRDLRRVVLIGVGNPDRGDDAAGLALLERLRERFERGEEEGATGERSSEPACASMATRPPARVALETLASDGDLTACMDRMAGADLAVILDAVVSGAAAGQVSVLDASREPLPVSLRCASTHAIGLGASIEIVRALGGLPPRVWIYGLEAVRFEPHAPLSPEVARALPEIVERVWRDVAAGALTGTSRSPSESSASPASRAAPGARPGAQPVEG